MIMSIKIAKLGEIVLVDISILLIPSWITQITLFLARKQYYCIIVCID